MPQSSDDYGDFDGPIEPPKPDTQPLDGSAIGGLITDVIGGALNLFGAGVEILSDVIDGSVRLYLCLDSLGTKWVQNLFLEKYHRGDWRCCSAWNRCYRGGSKNWHKSHKQRS